MTVGASVAIGRAFSAGRWSKNLRTTGTTVPILVGPQIRMVMAQADERGDGDNRIRLVPYGLAVPLEMEEAFERRFGGPLCAMSGSTEAIAISYCEPAYIEHRWPSLGRPTADKEVAIMDEEGWAVPIGEPGELCIKGEPGVTLMLGYWNRPSATDEAIVDGWLHTGDIGKMDADGYIYFVDRKKDIIKRSGENVSASEVERAIMEAGGVAEVAVVGRPDPIRDEAVVAFVVFEELPGDIDKVRGHCEANLARFKVPEEFRIMDQLPHTSVGKIEKKVLRQLAENER
jgi:crotonobetaine/carnitine-CoA ligase